MVPCCCLADNGRIAKEFELAGSSGWGARAGNEPSPRQLSASLEGKRCATAFEAAAAKASLAARTSSPATEEGERDGTPSCCTGSRNVLLTPDKLRPALLATKPATLPRAPLSIPVSVLAREEVRESSTSELSSSQSSHSSPACCIVSRTFAFTSSCFSTDRTWGPIILKRLTISTRLSGYPSKTLLKLSTSSRASTQKVLAITHALRTWCGKSRATSPK
mmetsp:Transcript_58541/g.128362  ORF Transcript_58541/g.128362 Transcript_58541/m.128362 type:complete len:220 (-) Transcript_58541:1406-2065(-)